MKLTFLGASGGVVTGSCYLLETPQARILTDCGQFQGGKAIEARNKIPPVVQAHKLDAVILTHAHLDHCGRLPLLERAGFTGRIMATPATIELTGLILRDAAKVQLHDTDRENKKRERAGKEPLEPLFTLEDVEAVLKRLRPVPYNKEVVVASGIRATYHEAGHMLGSASVSLKVHDGRRDKVVVFSGDIGPRGFPILKDAVAFQKADAVVMESTYGDRDHRSLENTLDELRTILREVVEKRGRALVPVFAVGRAQQMIYHILEIFSRGELEPFPIHVDSPMASGATQIYRNHPELFDEEAHKLRMSAPMAELYRLYVHETESVDDSIALNDQGGPCLILAGSGMCNAGRILHHLRHGLWQPNTHVIIVGYQAEGTLGRMLVQGRPEVKIFGERIAVRARVHTLNGFSAHAGQSDLLDWFGCVAADRPAVFLTHGEQHQRDVFAQMIHARHELEPWLPEQGECVNL